MLQQQQPGANALVSMVALPALYVPMGSGPHVLAVTHVGNITNTTHNVDQALQRRAPALC